MTIEIAGLVVSPSRRQADRKGAEMVAGSNPALGLLNLCAAAVVEGGVSCSVHAHSRDLPKSGRVNRVQVQILPAHTLDWPQVRPGCVPVGGQSSLRRWIWGGGSDRLVSDRGAVRFRHEPSRPSVFDPRPVAAGGWTGTVSVRR